VNDIEALAAAILADEPLIELDPSRAELQPITLGDANGLVRGALGEGAVLRGGQSLVVRGGVSASLERPCTVQARDTVVVQGDATGAHVAARQVVVQGRARTCRLVASESVEVGGDLDSCRLSLGGYDEARNRISIACLKAQQAAQERALIEQRLRVDERRVERLLSSTRVVCEFNLGQLIRRRSDRVQIDLAPLYQVIGTRDADDVDAALIEFFNRAVVGRLALANQAYLKANPNHQRVFSRLLTDLRGLFMLTREHDRAMALRDATAVAVGEAVEALRHREVRLCLHGAVQGTLELQFTVPQIDQAGDAEVTYATAAYQLLVTPQSDPPAVAVNPAGVRAPFELPPGGLRSVVLSIVGGQVAWVPLAPGPAA
jgi:hypothetical protein